MWNNDPSSPNPNFCPPGRLVLPPPMPPLQPDSSGTTVIYADPRDQDMYERRQRRQDMHFQVLRQQEHPSIRRHRESIAHIYRFNPANEHVRPDFKTIVRDSMSWLDPVDSDSHTLPPQPPPLYPSFYPGPPVPEMPSALVEDPEFRAKLVRNRDMYMMLMDATENFCAGEWTLDNMEPIYDGVYPWSASNINCLAAAEFAISSSTVKNGRPLRLDQLMRVNGKVLMGFATIYWLTLAASGKFYEVVVVVSSRDQTEKVVKFIRPAKYFPEIPAHLHHLLGPD